MNVDLQAIPRELKARPQWVCFKSDKTPVNPRTGRNAKADDPTTWATFAEAVKYYEAHKNNGIAGLGYEFSYYDKYTGCDWDDCRDPETGQLKYCAQVLLDYLSSYGEASPSGTGYHVLLAGKLPRGEGNQTPLNCGGKIEVYNVDRFFTVTGNHLPGTPTTIQEWNKELKAFHAQVIAKPKAKNSGPSPTLDLSDQELIEKALHAADGAKFSRLWKGDTTGYPSLSEADYALAHKLAFWTNKNPERIDRLFKQSGLCQDPERLKKWKRLAAQTIRKAIANTPEGYEPRKAKQEAPMSPLQTEKNQPALKVVKIPAQTSNPQHNFNLTDLGNGQRLVARHGDDLRYCYPWGKWLIYDGQRWAKDLTGEIERRAKETVRNIYAEAATIKDKDSRAAMADHAKRSESDSKRQAMINSARSEPGIPLLPDDLDRDPWLLNVLNGTIDLRTGQLRPHCRDDFITKLAPVHFDPKARCPLWWKFLGRILPPEIVEFVQKAVGYALTGITREQCLFFLYGLGANGKSTFIKVIQAFLGDYATQTTSETFMVKRQGGQISNDVADLRGARFVAAVEVESGRRMAEVLIKQMTGGDKIKARFLYSEYFEFDPEFKIFLAANHKPVIRGTDDAIWRRIPLVPFTIQIPIDERDLRLAEKLKAELPGILNWAIEGCLKWQDNGLALPQAVQEATQTYRQEMDNLAGFLAECCIIARGASAKAKDLYQAYTAWAEENGEKQPLNQRDFGMNLTERGFEGKRGTGGKAVRYGIGLKISEVSDP